MLIISRWLDERRLDNLTSQSHHFSEDKSYSYGDNSPYVIASIGSSTRHFRHGCQLRHQPIAHDLVKLCCNLIKTMTCGIKTDIFLWIMRPFKHVL